jgi:hypothetical protein
MIYKNIMEVLRHLIDKFDPDDEYITSVRFVVRNLIKDHLIMDLKDHKREESKEEEKEEYIEEYSDDDKKKKLNDLLKIKNKLEENFRLVERAKGKKAKQKLMDENKDIIERIEQLEKEYSS